MACLPNYDATFELIAHEVIILITLLLFQVASYLCIQLYLLSHAHAHRALDRRCSFLNCLTHKLQVTKSTALAKPLLNKKKNKNWWTNSILPPGIVTALNSREPLSSALELSLHSVCWMAGTLWQLAPGKTDGKLPIMPLLEGRGPQHLYRCQPRHSAERTAPWSVAHKLRTLTHFPP